jgi:beta-lactamase class A
VKLTYALLFIFLTSACSKNAPTQKDNPIAKPIDPRATKTDNRQNQELPNQIGQIGSAAKGRVGVEAVVLETGESVSLNPHDHFPMQSVYKLPIGLAVLEQVDAGQIKLDQKMRVTKSDLVGKAAHSPIRDKYPSQAFGIPKGFNLVAVGELRDAHGSRINILLDPE